MGRNEQAQHDFKPSSAVHATFSRIMQCAVSSSMPKSLKNSQAEYTYNRIGWAMSAICWHHLQRLAS
jgi:hypothetical protein